MVHRTSQWRSNHSLLFLLYTCIPPSFKYQSWSQGHCNNIFYVFLFSEEQAIKRQETRDELEYLDKQLILLTSEIKDKIKSMVEEVERNVSFALNDEIKRLSALVDEFSRPFHPDNLVLNVYKKVRAWQIKKLYLFNFA